MAKVFSATPLNKRVKKRISLRIPRQMKDEIINEMKKHGIPEKKRSKWISEAIVALSQKAHFTMDILEEWIESGQNTPTQITLAPNAETALQNMLSTLKEAEVTKNDMQSATDAGTRFSDGNTAVMIGAVHAKSISN